MSYPSSIDVLTTPTNSQYMNDPSASSTAIVGALNTAVTALENKVGVTGSAVTTSLDYKTSRLTAKGDILTHDGTNPIRHAAGTNGYMLLADSTQANGLRWAATTAGGTVTSVSVATANGMGGTVATATTTPAITLKTSVNGLVKGNGTAFSAATAGTDYLTPLTALPPGSVQDYAGSSAPTGWLLCDGTAVSRATYSALFAITGVSYGAGNGTTTFNLPDARGRVSVGVDGGTFAGLGTTGGAQTHTLNVSEIPSHTHAYSLGNSSGASTSAAAQGNTGIYAPATDTGTGGGLAHNNLQPYLTFNKIIKY